MRRPRCGYNYALAIAAAALFLSFSPWLAQCQVNVHDYSGEINNSTLLPLLTQTAYNRLSNLTYAVISNPISESASFCIKDPQVEWDRAFNYSSNLTFLSSCLQKTNGDMSLRLCTAAEAKFYFNNFVGGGSGANNAGGSGVLPNKNCNLTSWVPGCEPGWACSVNPTADVSLNESEYIPSRTLDCQACCEGFFCPQGLTCMIPCPLGSYCPLATLNVSTGLCDPYLYHLPPGRPNHTCGAANIWTDVARSVEVFCSPGSYCPTSTEEVSCSSGNYCRMGAIHEQRCSKLTSCHANSAYQNVRAYGVMLMAALAAILLVIYNFCDQVISIRERRQAKHREAAARSVRKKIQAHQRWKSAKNAAMKHVRGFQSQLSRTFSRKETETPTEELRIIRQTDIEIDDDLWLTTHALSLSSSEQSSAVTGGKKTEPSDLMTGIHATDEGPRICKDNTMEVEDKNLKSRTPKKKKLRSDTQIFKYAYGQLEIEKAMQQQNLTFSGAISMASNLEIKKRPEIEVSFRDLTLTLKGSNKHLLRCITGNILPGRITAVMGPSGAGKTTFLSALVGRTVGCKMTGSILINGKNESIRSYRKIIGFVPQDDIVHGNLTVEENLWFSARCRLSANLPKAEKVLIVERVIEELGLQVVRDSLVGTVEKRGISGGQRKRVNVGLELVMEPSLLILDEPTSGLDSSSSQLLLMALRREALVGVNICLVVHQPSYTLFKMFDDLILLAKGGLTVYHGPVVRVEEYFAGLGINVPERVNPPDHYIDVLEDIVKPSTSSGISSRELPVQWMLHKGYMVPPEMHQNFAGFAIHNAQVALHNQVDSNATLEEQSFTREVWQDVRHNVGLQRDIIRLNFLRSRDLSNRRTPGVLLQYKYFVGRVVKQRLREASILAIDFLILLLAGACIGTLLKFNDSTFGAALYTYTIIAVSLLCTISALRSFSQDKLQYWRESDSGISSLAHFLSKDTVDHLNTVIKPAFYLSLFYSFTNPRSSFSDNYLILLCLVYCVTGIGYALSVFLEPGPSQLCAVLLPVVLTLITTQTANSTVVKNLANLCYPKWALEAFIVANAERYSGVWIITRCGLLKKLGYSLDGWGRCITLLILAGVVTRAIAYVGMLTLKRKR